MRTGRILSTVSALAFGLSLAVPAGAVTVIQAGDVNVGEGQPTPLSDAAAASFDLANPPTFIETFEDGDADGFTVSAGSITSSPSGGGGFNFAFNTTPGGSFVLQQFGTSATFTFAAPVSAFGFYLTGVQSPSLTFNFDDGIQQIVPIENYAGVQFFGVSDFAQPVSSFTFANTNDIVGFDDFRYTTAAISSAVPEPSTWAMMLIGLFGVGAVMRRTQASRAHKLQFA